VLENRKTDKHMLERETDSWTLTEIQKDRKTKRQNDRERDLVEVVRKYFQQHTYSPCRVLCYELRADRVRGRATHVANQYLCSGSLSFSWEHHATVHRSSRISNVPDVSGHQSSVVSNKQ